VKVTGYRSLTTHHDWGRRIGDVNHVNDETLMPVHVLIVTTDEGIEGVGIGAHPDIEKLFGAVAGEDPRGVVGLYDRMCAHVFKMGHQGAVAGTIGAIDMALWDIKAKAAGEPLWRFLGGRDRFVPGYASGLDMGLDDDELVALHMRFADRGYRSAKLKGGRHLDRDLKRFLLLRDVYSRQSSAPAFMIDANEAWHRSQAVRYVRKLEETIDLAWVEEPVRRWDAAGHAAVRAGIRAGVASGENLTGLEQFRPLLDADALDIVQVGWGWGTTLALRVAAAAHARDLPVSPVGFWPAIAPAAAAMPNMISIEVQDLTYPYGMGVDQEIMDGGIVLGDQPGHGLTVDEEAIGRLADDSKAQNWQVRPARAGLRLTPEDDSPLDH
jgi:L-alanine-DL-glutamate epimerase-like enolase superfamily enzyme